MHEAITITLTNGIIFTTAGSTEITLFNKPVKFQVITSDLASVPGILGTNFLKTLKATISFYHEALIIPSRPNNPIQFVNNYKFIEQTTENYRDPHKDSYITTNSSNTDCSKINRFDYDRLKANWLETSRLAVCLMQIIQTEQQISNELVNIIQEYKKTINPDNHTSEINNNIICSEKQPNSKNSTTKIIKNKFLPPKLQYNRSKFLKIQSQIVYKTLIVQFLKSEISIPNFDRRKDYTTTKTLLPNFKYRRKT